MPIRCCKDCEDRQLHCHSTCERYIQEKREHDRLREKQREDQQLEYFDYKRKLKHKHSKW